MRKRVSRYEDLDVYQAAFDLQQEIFSLTKRWPKAEMYALTDQIRRASRAVGSNIAEAWAKRRYEAHFASKLTDADGEQAETRHWLRTAFACEYLDATTHAKLEDSCCSIGAMLGKMILNAKDWVQH